MGNPYFDKSILPKWVLLSSRLLEETRGVLTVFFQLMVNFEQSSNIESNVQLNEYETVSYFLVLCAPAVLRPRALQDAPAPADPKS